MSFTASFFYAFMLFYIYFYTIYLYTIYFIEFHRQLQYPYRLSERLKSTYVKNGTLRIKPMSVASQLVCKQSNR